VAFAWSTQCASCFGWIFLHFILATMSLPRVTLALLSLSVAMGVATAFMDFNQPCPGFLCASSKKPVPNK
jgi:hypothetical protein